MNEMGIRIKENTISQERNIQDDIPSGLQPLEGDDGNLSSTAERVNQRGYYDVVIYNNPLFYTIDPGSSTYPVTAPRYECSDKGSTDPAVWSIYIRSWSWNQKWLIDLIIFFWNV